MDFHIDLETLEFFVALVIAGGVYGNYLFNKGIRIGWDNAMYTLQEENIISINEEGEVYRVNDKQYKECRDYK